MKFILSIIAASFAMMACHSCAQAQQVQSDDVAFARDDNGRVLALSAQACPIAGFYYWHIESDKGKTLATGCYTIATHQRIMVTDGKGEAIYFPFSRFSGNPAFELGTPHAVDDDNVRCRGGSGDDPETWAACRRRDAR
jgi:hypothetical protein